MNKIKVGKNNFAVVDEGLFNYLSKFIWKAVGSAGYKRATTKIDGKRVQMHRLVMLADPGLEVDHINGDSLDNRTENLRICTHKENLRNRKTPKNNTTGYKGVSFTTNYRYETTIKVDGKTRHIGIYKRLTDAALAYNKAALKYFGEYARLNQVKGIKC